MTGGGKVRPVSPAGGRREAGAGFHPAGIIVLKYPH
jgi:hypothetical protein